jgi:hypothetical protein
MKAIKLLVTPVPIRCQRDIIGHALLITDVLNIVKMCNCTEKCDFYIESVDKTNGYFLYFNVAFIY